jgi:hypothetical protein
MRWTRLLLALPLLAAACTSTASPPETSVRTAETVGPASQVEPLTTTVHSPPTTQVTATTTTTLATVGEPGRPGCNPPAPIASWGNDLTEVEGTSNNAELWALIFWRFSSLPPVTGEDIKIVWRMTGSGNFSVEAVHEEGELAELTFGPDHHTESNWQRPGEEWGTGFIFPKAGCWDLHARREGGKSGHVWLVIQEAGG